jgi:hypothetical protein
MKSNKLAANAPAAYFHAIAARLLDGASAVASARQEADKAAAAAEADDAPTVYYVAEDADCLDAAFPSPVTHRRTRRSGSKPKVMKRTYRLEDLHNYSSSLRRNKNAPK